MGVNGLFGDLVDSCVVATIESSKHSLFCGVAKLKCLLAKQTLLDSSALPSALSPRSLSLLLALVLVLAQLAQAAKAGVRRQRGNCCPAF